MLESRKNIYIMYLTAHAVNSRFNIVLKTKKPYVNTYLKSNSWCNSGEDFFNNVQIRFLHLQVGRMVVLLWAGYLSMDSHTLWFHTMYVTYGHLQSFSFPFISQLCGQVLGFLASHLYPSLWSVLEYTLHQRLFHPASMWSTFLHLVFLLSCFRGVIFWLRCGDKLKDN